MKWLGTIAMLLGGCAVPEGSEKVLVFGHGGAGVSFWPMNTRGSVQEGWNNGSDGVEVDIQLTADTVLVAFHDPDLSLTGCAGRVNAIQWSDLQACRVGGHDNTRYPIARLDSLIPDHFDRRTNVHVTLDCKLFAAGEWSAYVNAYVLAIGSLIEHHSLHGRVNVECMDVDFLVKVKHQAPGASTFLYATEAEAGIDTALARGFSGITIDHRLIDRAQVERAQQAGLRVAVFGTYGGWSHQAALRLRPDMIQTDDVPGLLRLQGR